MEVKLVLDTNGHCRLPLNNHHLIQSMIYQLLQINPSLSDSVHNQGYRYEKRVFKLFTFSQLQGKHKIHKKNIIFTNRIYLSIRSVDEMMIQTLVQALLKKKRITLGNNILNIHNLTISYPKLTSNRSCIRMLSPIVVRSTDKITNKSVYYNPLDKEFEERLIKNFRKKYYAFYGKETTLSFQIKPIGYSEKNKVVTKYKNYYITAWKGDYELLGDKEALDFLYQVGLGEKNSSGFGEFMIIDKEE